MTTIFVNKIKNNQGGNSVQINQLRGINTAGSITVQGEGTATTNLQQGLVKCWCYWETTDTVRDSFNSSGLTDNGTGDATYSYTNNMANDDYASFFVGNGREYESPFFCDQITGADGIVDKVKQALI